MCFSSLPIEFDEKGNPYLTEEAEEIDHPDCGHSHGNEEDALDQVNPREAYDDIMDSLPEEVDAQLTEKSSTGKSPAEKQQLRSD